MVLAVGTSLRCRLRVEGMTGAGAAAFPTMEPGCGGRGSGLICAIVTVCMVFISLTSAYVVRQGLPTFDDASNSYVRDWGEVHLPWVLLAINTAVLLISSLTMELARRAAARQAALAPVMEIPGVSLGKETTFPWLGLTVLLGFGFLVGQWLAWGELHNRGFYMNTNPSSSFAFLLTITHAVHLTGGLDCAALGGQHFPAAAAGGGAADCCRRHGLVLAFHGRAVDLYFCAVGVRAIGPSTTNGHRKSVHKGVLREP